MASAVEDALAEVNAAIAAQEPQLEGLRDDDRLNLIPASQEVVTIAITDFERRYSLLVSVKGVLEQLIADGYPTVLVYEVSQEAYGDLTYNKNTIDAALALFKAAPPPEASGFRAEIGPPEPKPQPAKSKS